MAFERKIDYMTLANTLLDYICDNFGIIPTINYLHNIGYSVRELKLLKFEEQDIRRAIKK